MRVDFLDPAREELTEAIGFPYGIIYQTREGVVLVVGVMHLYRNPEYWKSRLSRP
ncbi:MAG: hypothetical protein ACYTAS_15255 [Planctomycetota bacterium]|jgi:hypothetical protein